MLKVFIRIVRKWQMVFLFAIGLSGIALADEVKYQDNVISKDTPVREGEEILVFSGDNVNNNPVSEVVFDSEEKKDVSVDVISDDTVDDIEVVDSREEEEVDSVVDVSDNKNELNEDIKENNIKELTPIQKAKMMIADYAKKLAQAKDFLQKGKIKNAVEIYKELLKVGCWRLE